MIKVVVKVIFGGISKIMPKDKNLIILAGTSNAQYNENTRYLFEYISSHPESELNPFWVTTSQEVFDFLTERKLNVFWHKSFKSIWLHLRAGFVVGTGIEFPNILNCIGGKTIKICLHHAMGPRSTNAGYEYPKNHKGPRYFRTSLEIVEELHKWDFFNFTSKYMSMAVGKLQYLMPKHKRMVWGYPRNDHLFQFKDVDSSFKYVSALFPDIKFPSKIILFSPTFRINDRSISFPINLLKGFDLDKLNKFLMEQDAFLLVSRHPYMDKWEDFSTVDRIRYIKPAPLFDINLLLPEVSILITDYSSIATDFGVLDRPIVYVLPDYEEFLYDRGLLEDMRDNNLAGQEALVFQDLIDILQKYLSDPKLDQDLRKKYLRKYYDLELKNSCQAIQEFMLEKRNEI